MINVESPTERTSVLEQTDMFRTVGIRVKIKVWLKPIKQGMLFKKVLETKVISCLPGEELAKYSVKENCIFEAFVTWENMYY